MKKFRLKGKRVCYNLINGELVPTKHPVNTGSNSFLGELVYIPMGERLVPMIKVYSKSNNGDEDKYYMVKDVVLVDSIKYERQSSIGDYPQYDDAEHSNAGGSFWDKLKNLTKKKELTEAEMKEAHKKSGSKMSFGDWIKTPQATSLANNLLGLAFSQGSSSGSQSEQQTSSDDKGDKEYEDSEDKDDDSKNNVTILGMKPLTFGLVSAGTLIAIVGTIALIRKFNK